MPNTQETTPEKVRIDKWLWAARFFKTRQLAVKALKNSNVSINGQTSKPATMVKIDDIVKVKKGIQEFEVTVLGLSENRGPAKVAQQLYFESDESKEKRKSLGEQLRAMPKIQFDTKKPDKRGVRSHRAVKRGESS